MSYLYKLDLDERTSVTILAPLTVHASLQKMASLHGFQLLRMPTSNLAVTEAIGRPVAALQANARALHLTLANGAAEFAENIVHLLPKNKTQDLESIKQTSMPKDVKLLLVEDNKVNQTVSVAMLTVPEQYQIDIAANGYSVIIMAEQTWC
jgi:hypothetical protein